MGVIVILGTLTLGSLCLWLAQSEERTFVDEWHVRVLDDSQAPVPAVRVTESCDDYSDDWSGGNDFFTDANGEVMFPRHSLKASRFYWAVVPTLARLDQGVHAGSGIYGRVNVSDPRTGHSDSDTCRDEACRSGPMHSVIKIPLHTRATEINLQNK